MSAFLKSLLALLLNEGVGRHGSIVVAIKFDIY